MIDSSRSHILKVALGACALIAIFFIFYYIFGNKKEINKNHFEQDAYVIKGIDVSHHNTITNWEKVAAEGVDFVYMKATEGTDHEDRDYLQNDKMAKEAGIKVGAYHFYTFAVSGEEQAKHYIKTVNCEANDLIPAIDVEHTSLNPYSTDANYIKKVIQELKVLEKELHKYYGKRPIIYTNRECYTLYIEKNFPDNLLWIGDLNQEPESDWKNWRIWQFSHRGRVSGIEGHVDLNYYRYSAKYFSELLLP